MFKRYALITNGVVTNIVDQVDVPPAELNPVLTDTAQIGWTYSGGIFAVPTTPAPVVIPLAQQALMQLNIVTGVSGQVMRCMAAGVAVPAAWITYIAALRAIANGTDTKSTALPATPAYVAGT
jgi:hypothetical protein